MDITIIKKIVQPQESTELFSERNSLEKTENYGWIDLTIYTETVQAAGHSRKKKHLRRMMERQEGGQV